MNAQQATRDRLASAYDPLGAATVCGHMSHQAYHDLAGINASVLKKPTTLEMLYALQEPQTLKYAFQFGSLVHLAVLEPDKFDGDRTPWLVQIDTATLKSKAAESAYLANPDKIIASQRMIDKAARARDAAYRHRQFAAMMADGVATEVCYQAWSEKRNVWQKGLLDIVPRNGANWIGDLKTTSVSISNERKLEYEVKDRGYDFSAAYYTELREMVEDVQIENYVLVWIAGPTADSADVDDEPWMCRMQVIPRIATETRALSLAPIFDDITNQLDALRIAYETDQWDAYEHEALEF